jgi:hypothetical protein
MVIVCLGSLTMAGCDLDIPAPSYPDWDAAFAAYSAQLYGQVTLPESRSAGAGVSIVVAVYVAGCTGTMAETFGNETTTDADGRFRVQSHVFKSSLPPGNPDSRVLCTRITASGPLPADTASVLIPNVVHRAVSATDSTRADLRLP